MLLSGGPETCATHWYVFQLFLFQHLCQKISSLLFFVLYYTKFLILGCITRAQYVCFLFLHFDCVLTNLSCLLVVFWGVT